ncbi:hypothetical protein G3I13_24060 [Streptomyces sp. SID6673]|nr:hypothetical protein [Streptomyces sp. SID11726]NEB27424.1 hypothetical protein [Streptomyces sp. SID6673]
MDLFDVTRIAARRWWVTVPIVAVVLLIAYGNYASVKPQYYSYATIGLAVPSVKVVPPTRPDGSTVQITNGLADNGGPGLLASLLTTALGQPQVTSKVVAGGGIAPVTAAVKPSESGSAQPIVEISAEGPDAYAVKQSVALTVRESNTALRDLQASAQVPPSSMATTFVVAAPSEPFGAMPARTRELIATVLAGLLVAIIAAVVVDALLGAVARRRDRRGRAASRTTDGTPVDERARTLPQRSEASSAASPEH